MLSPEQEIAFQKFCRGENLLISGPGGTGKSFLIKTLVEHMCSRNEFNFQVTSTTGCSSVLLSNSIEINEKNLSVKTINSWAGIKLCKGDNETIVNSVLKNPKMLKTWRKIRTLIIDEVSMISCKMFDVLILLAKKTRRNSNPFGGIQLVLLGDYLQLPPIADLSDPETSKYAFESKGWYEVIPLENHIELKTIFRQKDEIFKNILNEVRIGELSEESKEILKSYVGRKYEPKEDNRIIPIQILPTRKQVLEVNSTEYGKVMGEEYKFISKIDENYTVSENGRPISEKERRQFHNLTQQEKAYELNNLKSSIPVDEEICLKVGVPVMILVNLDLENGISNGTQGIVISMRNNCPVVRLMNGSEKLITPYMWQSSDYPTLVIWQLPLTLSYASSVHKQQGSTIDIARMTLGFSIFEDSQIYVALSRLTSLDGLYLTSFHPQKISVNKRAKAFYEGFNK